MPFYTYSLFKNIFALAEEKGYEKQYSTRLLAFVFIGFTTIIILPQPFSLISLFSFFPLITVLKAFNYFWQQEQPDLKERTRFSGGEIAILIICGIVIILLMMGAFVLFTLPQNFDPSYMFE